MSDFDHLDRRGLSILADMADPNPIARQPMWDALDCPLPVNDWLARCAQAREARHIKERRL